MRDVLMVSSGFTYRALLSLPAFRRLWFGELVSNFGDWFTLIASSTLLVEFGAPGAAVGTLFAIRMLAPFLVSPIAGVLADRRNRKRIMIAADLLRAVVVCGFLFVDQPGEVWMVYVLTAAQLGLSGFFVPARNAILPELIPAGALGAANALTSATFATMLAFGAGIGGLFAGVMGLQATFLVDAATFVLSALCACAIVYRPTHGPSGSDRNSPVAQYTEGMRYLRRDRESLFLSLQKGINGLFITGGLNVLTVSVAVELLPVGQEGSVSVGILFCATGLGTALGPVVARRIIGDDVGRLRRSLSLGYLVSALGMAVFAPALGLALAALGMIVRAAGGGMLYTFSSQLLMTRVPPAVRGRVFSTEYAMRTLLNAAGTIVVGLLVDSRLGVVGASWVVAVGALVPAVLWQWWLWHERRPAVAGSVVPPRAEELT